MNAIDPQLEMSMPLSAEESERLRACEATIAVGLRHFLDVGKALIEISEGGLYRQTHPTFAAYCSEKWDLSARHARRLREAAQIVEGLPDKWDQLVRNEAQIRELVRLPAALRVPVLEKALGAGPKLTAKHIRLVAESLLPTKDAKSPPSPTQIPLMPAAAAAPAVPSQAPNPKPKTRSLVSGLYLVWQVWREIVLRTVRLDFR